MWGPWGHCIDYDIIIIIKNSTGICPITWVCKPTNFLECAVYAHSLRTTHSATSPGLSVYYQPTEWPTEVLNVLPLCIDDMQRHTAMIVSSSATIISIGKSPESKLCRIVRLRSSYPPNAGRALLPIVKLGGAVDTGSPDGSCSVKGIRTESMTYTIWGPHVMTPGWIIVAVLPTPLTCHKHIATSKGIHPVILEIPPVTRQFYVSYSLTNIWLAY